MYLRPRWQLLFVILMQLVLMLSFNSNLVFNPGKYTFHNSRDGFKNYYTFAAYAEDITPAGNYFNFEGYNYPYGDLITYTDNTPLLAVVVKGLNKVFPALKGYNTYVFDIVVLLQFVFASVFVWLILRKLISNTALVVFFSVLLPLLNPQVLRFVQGGTLNLSFSCLILAPIYFLLVGYLNAESGKKYGKSLLSIAMLVFLVGYVHVYYSVIVVALLLSFAAAYAIYKYIQKQPGLKFAVGLVLATIIPFLLFYCLLVFTDAESADRNKVALGYNVSGWKLTPSSLFTAYHFIRNKFFIYYTHYIPYEGHIYLGSFFLYFFVVFLVLRLVKFLPVKFSKFLWYNTESVFVTLLFIASVVLLAVSVGNSTSFGNNEYEFVNYFSAFFYISKFSSVVTHFRCLGRFAWPFFWAVNFMAIFLYANVLNRASISWKVVLYLLLLAPFIDALNTYDLIRTSQHDNVFTATANTELEKLAADVPAGKYQAILPLPYYHIGSESHDASIDPTPEHVVNTTALAYHAKLPLMSSMMSRTSVVQSKSFFSIFNDSVPDAKLLSKLDDRPILVFCDSTYYADSTLFGGFEHDLPRTTFYNSRGVVSKYKMQQVGKQGSYNLYELSIGALRGADR